MNLERPAEPSRLRDADSSLGGRCARILVAVAGLKGGAIKRLRDLLTSLEPERFDITLVSYFPETLRVHLAGIPCVRTAYDLGVESFQRPEVGRGLLSLPVPTAFGFRYMWMAARILRRHRPRLIYLNDYPWDHFPLLFLAKCAGTKVMSDLQGGRNLYRAEKSVLRCVDRFMVLSDHARRFYAAEGIPDERMTLIRNGISAAEFDARSREASPLPDTGADAVNVVFVGWLNQNKRPELALDAFRLARQRCPRLRLIFVGDGPRALELREQVARAGLEGDVAFAGYAENIPAILRQCHIGLMMSKREGAPFAVLEYMAAGLPVISVPLGGMDEMIESGRSGVIVERGEAAEVAEVLVDLYHSPERRRSMGLRSRQIIESPRFSIDRQVHDLREAVTAMAADDR